MFFEKVQTKEEELNTKVRGGREAKFVRAIRLCFDFVRKHQNIYRRLRLTEALFHQKNILSLVCFSKVYRKITNTKTALSLSR